MKKKNPVNLTVVDKEMEDIVLTEYPEAMILLPEDLKLEDMLKSKFGYIQIDIDSDGKRYNFLHLEKDILLGFLETYKQAYEYEVRDLRTGDFIVVNKLKRKYAEPNVLTFGASMN